ncbi:MAG: phosphatidate cytidylyltransferase [Saprospiraceae bacterium]|nr:phosphatidate cytidylyltransferase [Saprospiraceae bacterium]
MLQRAITGFFFIAVMVGGIYGGRYTFLGLFAIITAGCLWEYLGIVLESGRKRDLIRKLLGVVLGLTPFAGNSLLHLGLILDEAHFISASALLLFPLLFLAFIYEMYAQSEQPFANIGYTVLGAVYIGVPFALLEFIAFDDKQFFAGTVMGLLIMTWGNDSAAYLFGSRWGRRLLFPRLSPKKTWEGFWGGAVFTLLSAGVLSLFFKGLTPLNWLILGVIVIVFGTFGDLVESMLKRSFHAKDSGDLLPGHGGLLDRFDGFIFLLPFAAAYILLLR